MHYHKPEVSLLGNASSMIETLVNKNSIIIEGVTLNGGPAYDLDE